MTAERRGRLRAAPFRVGLVVFFALVLGTCVPLTRPQAGPDELAAIVGGARIPLSPQLVLSAGNGVGATLALRRIADRPIARDLQMTLTDATGAAVDDATVIVVAEMPGMKDAPIQAVAHADGDGRYVARVVFPMRGAYAVRVIVNGRGGVGSLRLEIDIAS